MIRNLRAALAALTLALGCSAVWAQASFPTPGGSVVDGKALMCPNGSTDSQGRPIMIPCGGASAPLVGAVKPGQVTPLSPSCQLSVSSSAVQTSTCSGGIPSGATYALICNEGTAARWRDDGTAPTAGIGQVLGTGTATAPVCAGFVTTLSTLQWIAESGSATLDISFYK